MNSRAFPCERSEFWKDRGARPHSDGAAGTAGESHQCRYRRLCDQRAHVCGAWERGAPILFDQWLRRAIERQRARPNPAAGGEQNGSLDGAAVALSCADKVGGRDARETKRIRRAGLVGPPEQGLRSTLRHDGRSFAFANSDTAGHAYRHESGYQRKQKLFHCSPLCCCPWLIERDCSTSCHCRSSA